MPDQPTMTGTQVKTKTVSKTNVALSLAFLGAAALAAAGVSLQTTAVCSSNSTTTVDLKVGWPSKVVYACKGVTIKPTNNSLDSFLVRSYDANNLVVRINGQYVTFKYGDVEKPIGKPLGNVPGYQTPMNLSYLGMQSGRAKISLLIGDVLDGKAGYCTDMDVSTQNFGGFSLSDKKYINPYVKGVTHISDPVLGLTNFEDKCGGLYDVVENYCNLSTGKLETATIKCNSECFDGKCENLAEEVVAINGETAVECCSLCNTWDTQCGLSQVTTTAACAALGGTYLGLVPYSQCVSSVSSTSSPKTCNDVVSDPNAFAIVGFCKNKGYEAVCFDKYSLVYQVCTNNAGDGCITNNVNAANNIRCLVAGYEATPGDLPGI